jgi:hypothetical protein
MIGKKIDLSIFLFSLFKAMKTENENEPIKFFFNTFILLGRKTTN